MYNSLVVIFAAAIVQVICETNTDVIASYASVFEKLHEDVNNIQTKTHGAVHDATRHLSSTVRHTQNELTRYQNEAKEKINEQVKETLDQLNLSSDNEKVKKCLSDNNDAIDKMIFKSEGGLQVCKNLDAGRVDDINVVLSGVYMQEEKVHNDLEGFKVFCNSTVKDVAQLKNCLYYQLFVVHVNSLNELKEESKQVVKNYEVIFENASEKLKTCSKVVQKNLVEEADQIALRFRNCGYEIMQQNK